MRAHNKALTYSPTLLLALAATLAACAEPPDLMDAGSEAGSSSETGAQVDPGDTGADDDDDDGDASEGDGDEGSDGGSGDDGTDGGSDEDTGDDDPPSPAVCGNGEVEADEVCDDGNHNGSYGYCADDCGGPGPFCGDGDTTHEEACDDGNLMSGDACSSDCLLPGTRVWGNTLLEPWGNVWPEAMAAEDDGVVVAVSYSNQDLDYGFIPVLRRFDGDGNEQWENVYENDSFLGGRFREVVVNRNAEGPERMFSLTHWVSYENDNMHYRWLDEGGNGVGVITCSGCDWDFAALGPASQAVLAEVGGQDVSYYQMAGSSEGSWSDYDGDASLRDAAITAEGEVIALLKRGTDEVFLRRYAPDGSLETENSYQLYFYNTYASVLELDSEGTPWVLGSAGSARYVARFDASLEIDLLMADTEAYWDRMTLDDSDNIYLAGSAASQDMVRKFQLNANDELEPVLDIEVPDEVNHLAVDGFNDVYILRDGFEKFEKYAG